MCFAKESALRGHKYGTGKAASIVVVVVAAIVAVIEEWGEQLLVYCVRMQTFEGDKPRHEDRKYKDL
jgi:hypothetical protein